MPQLRGAFRFISTNNSYQVKDYGPNNNAYTTFTPDDYAGLTTWIDADDISTISEDGGFIDSITNKGSVVCTFRPDVIAARPFLSGGLVNTRDVISFDGVDDVLSSSVGANSLFGSATPTTYTYAAVVKLNRVDASDSNPVALDILTSMASNGWTVTLGSSQGFTSRFWHDFGSADSINYAKSTVGQAASGSVMSLVINYLTKSYDMYINGTFVSGVVRASDPTVGFNSVRIGNEIWPSNGNAALFELCELALYSTSLTPAEIGTLSAYFADKWGF